MNELTLAVAWLDSTLRGDAALMSACPGGVWADFAPDKDPVSGVTVRYPLVVFSLQAASDVTGAGTDARLMTRPLYLVRVIGEGSGYRAVQAAANRIDALLTLEEPQSVTLGGETGTVLGSMRERPMQHAELDSGRRYVILGGMYRLWVQA